MYRNYSVTDKTTHTSSVAYNVKYTIVTSEILYFHDSENVDCDLLGCEMENKTT